MSLLCDKAIEITNAKTYVFADSVLCLEQMSDQPIEAWKNKIKWYLEHRYLKDLNRIDGEPMEFEWKIFPAFTTFIFMSMSTTLYGENKETQNHVRNIQLQ